MFSLKLSVVLSLSAAMTAVAVVPAYGQCGGSGWTGLHLSNNFRQWAFADMSYLGETSWYAPR